MIEGWKIYKVRFECEENFEERESPNPQHAAQRYGEDNWQDCWYGTNNIADFDESIIVVDPESGEEWCFKLEISFDFYAREKT